MKKILIILIVCLALVPVIGMVQNKESPLRKVEVVCGNEKEIIGTIMEDYKELPLATMISFRKQGDEELELISVLLVNPKSKSWTLVEKWNDSTYCIAATGNEIAPFGKVPNPV